MTLVRRATYDFAEATWAQPVPTEKSDVHSPRFSMALFLMVAAFLAIGTLRQQLHYFGVLADRRGQDQDQHATRSGRNVAFHSDLTSACRKDLERKLREHSLGVP